MFLYEIYLRIIVSHISEVLITLYFYYREVSWRACYKLESKNIAW